MDRRHFLPDPCNFFLKFFFTWFWNIFVNCKLQIRMTESCLLRTNCLKNWSWQPLNIPVEIFSKHSKIIIEHCLRRGWSYTWFTKHFRHTFSLSDSFMTPIFLPLKMFTCLRILKGKCYTIIAPINKTKSVEIQFFLLAGQNVKCWQFSTLSDTYQNKQKNILLKWSPELQSRWDTLERDRNVKTFSFTRAANIWICFVSRPQCNVLSVKNSNKNLPKKRHQCQAYLAEINLLLPNLINL